MKTHLRVLLALAFFAGCAPVWAQPNSVSISGLPAATTPLADTEVAPIVQGGATKKVSVANLKVAYRGTVAPSAPVVGQLWFDTTVTAYVLKQYDGSAWVTLGTLDTVAHSWSPAGVPAGAVTTTGTPASGNLTKFSGASSVTNGDLSGDCTTSGTLVIGCNKTGGVNFAASATTDTTNAGNIGSGTLPAGRLPNPSASTLGGVQSAAPVTHQFVTGISTSGVPSQAQPAVADISGLGAGVGTALGAAVSGSGSICLSTASSCAPPAAANPTATIGASAVNGSATTFMRSDAAPALPATLPALSGVNLTALNGSNIGSGTVGTGRLPVGKSVLDPGTGVLESLLPVKTNTFGGFPGTACTTSCVFTGADLQYEIRRSNGGVAMTDTFPAAAATGMANGARITVNNGDASAADTITPGAGTTISNCATVEFGRSVTFVYDLGNTTWRPTYNTCGGASFASASLGSLVPGNFASILSANGKVQDSGKSASSFAPAGGVTIVNGSNPSTLAANWAAFTQYTVIGAGRTITIPASSGLSTNGGLQIDTNGASVTVTATTPDTITWHGATTGGAGSVVLPKGGLYAISTDGAGKLYISDGASNQVGQTFTGEQRNCITTLTAVSNVFTPDNSCNNYKLVLGATNTIANFAAMNPGAAGVIEVDQDGTGSRTVSTWGSQIIAPGGVATIPFSAPANAKDFLSYLVLDSTHVLFAVGGLNASH